MQSFDPIEDLFNIDTSIKRSVNWHTSFTLTSRPACEAACNERQDASCQVSLGPALNRLIASGGPVMIGNGETVGTDEWASVPFVKQEGSVGNGLQARIDRVLPRSNRA